jgi:hypothetical protein
VLFDSTRMSIPRNIRLSVPELTLIVTQSYLRNSHQGEH